MRSSIFAIAVAANLASAQIFGAEPKCATACLVSAISVAGCGINDQACQCGTGQNAIQTAVEPCLLSSCSGNDLESAASVGLALCSVYSASLASASAKTTSSGSASGSVTSSASAASTSSSSVVSTTSVKAVTTSVPPTTSAPSTTSLSTSGSSSGSSSAPPPVSTNAAPSIIAGMGGLMGVAAAFVAAL